MPAYIVDSSVFILGMPLPNRIITTPDVLSELKDMQSRMAFEAAVDSDVDVVVEAPLPHLIDEVCSHARVTGDCERLSDTDIGLLAKTLEYNGILYTDDYAIQNVAGSIGIRTEPVVQKHIKERFEWGWRCVGCGRKFEGGGDSERVCQVCGSRLVGYRKSRRKLR